MEKSKTDNRDIREIDEIAFGIYSAEEIKRLAVCEVTSSKLCGADKNTGYGTVYDPRMGTIENGILCGTCNENVWRCPGHSGFIKLAEPIVHPLHYKRVVDFLRCFCIKCFKPLLTEDQIVLNNFNRLLGVKRFNKILEKLEKIDICNRCAQPQPDIKYTATDGSISMVYKQKDKDKSKVSIVLPVDEIKNIFDNISNEDVKLLGFNPELMHPRNLILTVFPVIPTCARPYIVSEDNICDDDLTIQLVEIIKANNHLKSEDGVPVSETKRQKYIQSLKFRISTFYNNSCLAPETPVLMWDGSMKRADEVECGDELVGDDGEIRTVESTCEGEDEMYEITQERGDTYVVNSNHYLTLSDDENIIVDVKVKDYLKLELPLQNVLKGVRVDPKNNYNLFYFSIKVTSIGRGKYNGFTIDKNHRFLLGDFTVTHNSGKAKHSTNGRVIKGLKERLTGKEGLIRGHLLGKRTEQSGRTVIGPDPTLRTGQLAVPPEMARNLTIPVQVTDYNLHELTKIVNDGKANYVLKDNGNTRINLEHKLFYKGTSLNHGDIVIRKDHKTGEEFELVVSNGRDTLQPGDRLKRNNEFITDIKYPEKRMYHLNVGDIVERQLMDGDYVLLNRQPTLHSGSMMAQEIVIRKGKTLRFNLAICKSFNSDFDGDEMNLHIPQSVEAQTELKLISASKNMIISGQGSRSNFCIVQDSLLAAYRMTLGNQPVRKDQYYDISMKLGYPLDRILKKIQSIRRVLKEKGKKVQCFNGKGLISLVFPEDFYYEKKNNADPDEPILRIYKGVLYEGTLEKSVLGATANSLIQIINKEYGADSAMSFIDGIQFISNGWLLLTGFSVGIEDCMIQGEEQTQKINDVIQKCYIEAEGIKNTTSHPGIREVRITATLSKAKDIGLRIAKEAFAKDNNFLSTIRSGAKGDWFNAAQITGLMAQQNLLGKRVKPTLNNGKRTLPHYPHSDLSMEMEYESRGFIKSSFIRGLNPKEMYFHSMSGREGCSDTAMNTSNSGYIQRRIVKLCEDIKVQYDHTTRDAIGSIYQVAYGEDGINPITTVKVGSAQEICDVSAIVNKLNMKHEVK